MAYFANYLYTTDAGAKVQTRISNNTVAAQISAAVQGAATIPGSVSFNVPSRKKDFQGRYLVLKRTVGTGAAAKSFFTRLGVLLPADFAAAGFALGATVAVNTVSYTVSSKVGERLK